MLILGCKCSLSEVRKGERLKVRTGSFPILQVGLLQPVELKVLSRLLLMLNPTAW